MADFCLMSEKSNASYRGLDYSTLILDCMLGDQTLYWRRDGVETSWKLLTPVLKKWEAESQEEKERMLERYAGGSWGPAAGNRFIEKDGRHWIVP